MSEGPLDLTEWEARYPWIQWRKPRVVRVADTVRYACRVCVANRGLEVEQVFSLPANSNEIVEHIVTEHAHSATAA